MEGFFFFFPNKTHQKNKCGGGGVMDQWECKRGRYKCVCDFVERKKREEKEGYGWPREGRAIL